MENVGKSRRRLWSRVALALLVLIVVAVATVVVGGSIWLRHAMTASLPVIDGQEQLRGLTAAVTVRRDGHGVPHIEAATLDDLVTAQGYVTAQDRLWQMDMARRNAEGRLAELLGNKLLGHDTAQRVLQIQSASERMVASMPERDRQLFDDYANGVNAYIQAHGDHLPAEFRLLSYKPTPWTAADSVAIGLSMVQMLDDHYYEKLGRERVTAKLGPALAADLYPTGSWRDHPPAAAEPDLTAPQENIPDVPLDESQTLLRNTREDLDNLRAALGKPECTDCQPGSNEWVISGAHTASGKPMLANDMHLEHGIPNIWYEVDLKAGDFHVAGVCVPGVPLIVAGHNDHIAWGFTSLYGDTQDIYVEQENEKGYYEAPDGWHPLKTVREVIAVRGNDSVTVNVQVTAHGPIITPLFHFEKRAISLKWNAYDPAVVTMPLYEIDAARDWKEFRAAAKDWWAPTINMVYADDAGNIGYQAAGWIPIRSNGLSGTPIEYLGKPIEEQNEWQGYVPFEELPSVFDPPSGLLATANSRVTPDGYAHPLTLGWASPYRNERIWKVLTGKNGLKRADMITLQTDVYSEVDQELAQRFAYGIDHASYNDARLREAADLLRSWNGVLTVDSPAAAIVSAAKSALWPLMLQPKLGDDWGIYQWPESTFAEEEIIMHGSAAWLPQNFKSWDDLLAAAVKKGLEDEKAPPTLKSWKYGSTHVVDLEHPLYGMLPWFKRWTGTGPQPQSGGHTTVKQVSRVFGPSQRFTMDWSDVDSSTENIVMGESGNPMSAYYKDQWPLWYGGTTFALPFSATAVKRAAVHTLQLVP